MAASERETSAKRPGPATTRRMVGLTEIPGGLHGGVIRPGRVHPV